MNTLYRRKSLRTLRDTLAPYRIPTVIVCIGIVLSIYGFVSSLNANLSRVEKEFQNESMLRYVALTSHIDSLMLSNMLANNLHRTSAGVADVSFGSIVSPLVNREDLFSTFLWVDKTENGEIASNFYILHPYTALSDTWNLSLSDYPEIMAAIEHTRNTGKPALSEIFGIPGGPNENTRYVATVFEESARDQPTGWLIGLIDLRPMLYKQLQLKPAMDENVYLFQKTGDDAYKPVFYHDGEAHFPAKGPDGDFGPDMDSVRSGVPFWFSAKFDALSGGFQLVFAPKQAFISEATGRLPWFVLFMGLALTVVIGYYTFTVVTRNVIIEKQVRRRTAELAERNQDLDDFVYIASHDLREPLRGIHNYANFLIEDYEEILDDDGKDKLRMLGTLSQKMGGQLSALLEFSRAGRENVHVERTDINEIVQSVLLTLHARIEETEAIVRIPHPLPVIRSEPAGVTEVMRNLIVNALKYNDSDPPEIEIGVLPEKSETGTHIFYVRDNGIGIAPKYHDIIFTIFKRLHTQDAYGGGTGSGLAIVKKLVARLGGDIWLESEPGAGTTFYFTLSG